MSQESSVISSLKELMELESDRIRKDVDEARAQMLARMEAEHRAQEALEELRREAERQKRVEDQLAREEQTRIEAIRLGEVAKARAEVETRARLQLVQQQQDHEQQLAGLLHMQRRFIRRMLVGLGVLFIVGVTGVGYMVSANTGHEQSRSIQYREVEPVAVVTAKPVEMTPAPTEIVHARPGWPRVMAPVPRRAASEVAKPPCVCMAGDPLCSCL